MRPLETTNSQSALPQRRELVAWMQGVSRYFDKPGFARALTNVSFEVRRGEVFGLLGPSGSGKSVTIRILAGRIPPSEGKARVFGRPPRRRSARMRVGYLPQKLSHTKSHLCAQMVDFLRDVFIWSRGSPRSTDDDIIPGTKRSLILKQALTRNPDLLLLDEPFSGLDPNGCNEMKGLIRTLAQQGRTVILSASSLAFTKDICDRVGVLFRGQLEATGTLEELLATSAGLRYLAELLPPATAERVLQIIRQDMGTGDSPGKPALQALERNPPGGSMEAAHGAPDRHQIAANAILAPLEEAPAIHPGSANEFTPTVNHELLAALAKKAAGPPPPPLESKPKP